MSLRAGDVVDGRYEVRSLLGQGGMGAVYRALDRSRGVDVALKLVRAELADAVDVTRFLREAELAARLDRIAGMVRVHAAGRHGGAPYYVMELVEGRDLGALMTDPALPLDARAVAEVVEQVARILTACHEAGVVHRDLKPGNVIVDPQGRARLLDLGLARDVRRETRLTATAEVLGTPAFMAPEQVEGAGVDARADVYALGAMLYQGLAGRPPFSGPLLKVLSEKVSRDPPPPSSLRSDVPAELEAVCRRAMSRDPAARHPTAAALADDLARWRAGKSIPGLEAARRRRRAAWLAVVGAAGVTVLAAGAAWRVTSAREQARAHTGCRAAEATLDAALEWDGWRCAADARACGGAHVLARHALGLGAGPAPDASELEARARELEASRADLPDARRPAAERALERLAAWRRLLDPAAPSAQGQEGALVAALQAAAAGDLRRAVESVGAQGPAAAGERTLVLARLAAEALRRGPDDLGARDLLALLPAEPTPLDATSAAGLARARRAVLADEAVASTWGEALGRRASVPVQGAASRGVDDLRRLLGAGPRDAAAEAGFLARLRAPIARHVAGSDLGLLRASLAERALGARWDVRALVVDRITELQLEGGRPADSPALVLAALAAGFDRAIDLARAVDLTGVEQLVADPAQSRAVGLVRVLASRDEAERLARARAAARATVDDVAPGLFAVVHKRRLEAATSLAGRGPARERAALVDEGLEAAARFRELAAVDPDVATNDVPDVLRVELQLECLGRGPAAAPAAVDRLLRWLDDAAGAGVREDWRFIRGLSLVAWLNVVSDTIDRGPAAAALLELSQRLHDAAVATRALGTGEVWEARGCLLRALRKAGELQRALSLVDQYRDEAAWGHEVFAAEATRTLLHVDLEAAERALAAGRRRVGDKDSGALSKAAEELRQARAHAADGQ